MNRGRKGKKQSSSPSLRSTKSKVRWAPCRQHTFVLLSETHSATLLSIFMYNNSFLDPFFTLTKLLPPSSAVSSPLCGTTGKSREGLDNFNSLSERQAGKCKSLLLRWENPLCYIKERLRGVQWTGKYNTPWICFTFSSFVKKCCLQEKWMRIWNPVIEDTIV